LLTLILSLAVVTQAPAKAMPQATAPPAPAKALPQATAQAAAVYASPQGAVPYAVPQAAVSYATPSAAPYVAAYAEPYAGTSQMACSAYGPTSYGAAPVARKTVFKFKQRFGRGRRGRCG
jgi:hypothetical protein